MSAKIVSTLGSHGPVSWAELVRRAAERLGYDVELVEGVSAQALGLRAQRPRYSGLGSAYGERMPTLDDALERYAHAGAHLRAPALSERMVG